MARFIHFIRFCGVVPALAVVMPPTHAASAKATALQLCTAKGGVLEPRGMLGTPRCVIRYKDAGASCRGKRDCQGRCLAAPGQPVITRPLGSPAKGICQADDSPFGCRADIEDGKIASRYICTD